MSTRSATHASAHGRRRPGGAAASRRGAVLPATLTVLVLAALAAMGALSLADAERASVAAALERTQARALAWSGVQAAMAELAAQRADILAGQAPVLTESWELFQRPSGARAVARLALVGPDGAPAAPESAKIDINAAPAEVLAKVPGLESAAAQIVALRAQRPFGSVDELVGVAGLSAAAVHGSAEGPDAGSPVPAGDRPAAPLKDLLTAWAFDPNIQSGLGERGRGHEGELRVNINAPWSDGMARAISRRFDEQTAEGVRRIMQDGRAFASDAAIVETLRFFQVEPADWVEALDAFTTSADPFVAGRVDINLAPAAVIACLPGFDEQTAEEVVEARSRLDAETLRSVAWPAIEGVLTPEQFQRAVGHITVRSAQWRVRVEAGYLDADSAESEAEAPLRGRMVLDAVIDIAAERPRVAYLRDATFLDLGLALALARQESQENAGEAIQASDEDDEDQASPAGAADAADPEPFSPSAAMARAAASEAPPTAPQAPQEQPRGPRARGPARPSREATEGPPAPGSESAGEKPAPPRVVPDAPGEDNRRGRWRPQAAPKSSSKPAATDGGQTGARP